MTKEQVIQVIDDGCDHFQVSESTDLVLIRGNTKVHRLLRDTGSDWILGLPGDVEVAAPYGSIADAEECRIVCHIRHTRPLEIVVAPESEGTAVQ